VARAFSEETSMADLTASIRDAGAFSDERASLIAQTETSRSQVWGNLNVWRELGLVTKATWQLSNEDPCPLCVEISEEGPYDLDELPIPVDDSHPNCACQIVSVELAE